MEEDWETNWSPSPRRGQVWSPNPTRDWRYVFRPKYISITSSSRYFCLHQKQKLQTLSESRVSYRPSLFSHNQILETLLFESGLVLRFRYVYSLFSPMKIRFELFVDDLSDLLLGFKKRILLWISSEYENSKIDTLYSH